MDMRTFGVMEKQITQEIIVQLGKFMCIKRGDL